MISLGARLVKLVLRAYTYPYRKAHRSLSRSIQFKSRKYRPPKGFTYRLERVRGVGVEILAPPHAADGCSIVQFHGGGHTQPMNNMYRKAAQRYAEISGYTVYSIDYRPGKDLVYPALHDACYEAYKGLIGEGLLAGRIVAAGDSMGANILLSICLRLRDEGLAMPKALISVSCGADLAATGDSYRKNCYRDPLYALPKNQSYEKYERCIRRRTPYCGATDPKDPYLSPAYAELTGFPPILIQCGDCEICESDSDMLYFNALKAGVTAKLTKYEGMFHDFQYITPFLKESRLAWKEIAAFIAQNVSTP